MTDETTVSSAAPTTGTEQAGTTTETTAAASTTQAATTATTETTAATEAADWRATITDPKVKEFASKFTSPADAAAAALQFRQKLSNAVNIPGKDAKPEEVAEFHKKLGVPETADGYEIAPPEDLVPKEAIETHKAGMQKYLKVFHETGVSAASAKAIMDVFYGDIRANNEATAKMYETAARDAEAELAKEWGGDFAANAQFSERAYKQFGNGGLSQLAQLPPNELAIALAGKPLGSHPAFMKAWGEVGRRTGEAGMHLPMTQDQVQSVDSEIDSLTTKAYEAGVRGDNAEQNRLLRQRDELVNRRYANAA